MLDVVLAVFAPSDESDGGGSEASFVIGAIGVSKSPPGPLFAE